MKHISLNDDLPHKINKDGLIGEVNVGSNKYFTPEDLTVDMGLWLDGLDGGTITRSGTAVSQWSDKSGNNNHLTQNIGANQPNYDAVNHKIDFAGLNNFLRSTTAKNLLNANGKFTLLIVQDLVNANSVIDAFDYPNIFTLRSTEAVFNDSRRPQFAYETSAGGTSFMYGSNGNTVVGDASPKIGQRIYGHRTNGPNDTMYFDGAEINSNASDSQTSTDLLHVTVGDGTGYYHAIGGIHEIILIPDEITQDEYQRLEGYLAWKWGLYENLPYEHPYRYQRPVVGMPPLPLWQPSSLPISAWLDMSDEDTITDTAGDVSQVDDKSPYMNHFTQGTASQQPTTGVASLNGRNGLRFAAVDDHNLRINANESLRFDDKLGYSIFSVFNHGAYENNGSGVNAFWGNGEALTGNALPNWAARITSGNLLSNIYGAGVSNNTNTNFVGENLVFGFRRDNTIAIRSEIYGDTDSYTSSFTGQQGQSNSAEDVVVLGGVPGSAARFGSMDMFEWIVIPTLITDEQFEKMQGYLAHKWGLTANLPVDHPYKEFAPLGGGDVVPSNWESQYYPSNWQPPTEADDFYTDVFLQDFSYAGYKKSEEAIPNITGPIINAVTSYGADPTGVADSTSAIQSAIDFAIATGGGVVYLPTGEYKVSKQVGVDWCLRINANNIILRGDGSGLTKIFCNDQNVRNVDLIRLSGDDTLSNTVAITQDLEGPTHFIPVADASAYNAGDVIAIRTEITAAWITEHGQGAYWSNPGSFPPDSYFIRKIVSINYTENLIEIDVPTRYSHLLQDNPYVVKMGGLISESGLEGFSISCVQNTTGGHGENDYNVVGTSAYEVHSCDAIKLADAIDCWIKDVHSYQYSGNTYTCHIPSNGIVTFKVAQCTIQDCRFERPQYGGGGGNGYMIRLSQANEVLVKDCHAEFNRHGLVISNHGTSGNVFLRCRDEDTAKATGDSGINGYNTSGNSSDHHQFPAFSNLIDNCEVSDSRFSLAHRQNSGTIPHGLAALCGVVWNCYGEGSKYDECVKSEQGRTGLIIGTNGICDDVDIVDSTLRNTEPDDIVEGLGIGHLLLQPSLFEDQLNKRGFNA